MVAHTKSQLIIWDSDDIATLTQILTGMAINGNFCWSNTVQLNYYIQVYSYIQVYVQIVNADMNISNIYSSFIIAKNIL